MFTPLSIQTSRFFVLPECAMCSNRHTCGQHVLGHLFSWPDLHNSPTWPTNTLTSLGYQRNFHQKTTRNQKIILQHCRKLQTSEKTAGVTKGSGIQTAQQLFVCGQTGKETKVVKHVISPDLASLLLKRKAQTQTQMLTAELSSIFNGKMTLQQDVMIPFQTVLTRGSAEQMYVECCVLHITQNSDPPLQL